MAPFIGLLLCVSFTLAGCLGVPPQPITPPSPSGAISFDDLAVVLPAVFDAKLRLDPTALAVQLPRLDRQLAALAQPWPAEVSRPDPANDQRLAWLYNARLAWSLRIAANQLQLEEGYRSEFQLPEAISLRTLLDTSFVLNGQPTTLADIDRELAIYDDFRLAAAAPCVSDCFGPPARNPFTAESVRAEAAERFHAYGADEGRILIDHDRQRVSVPPALAQFAGQLIEDYRRRHGTDQPSLAAVLAEHLDARGRRRLLDAAGHRWVERQGPALLRVQGVKNP